MYSYAHMLGSKMSSTRQLHLEDCSGRINYFVTMQKQLWLFNFDTAKNSATSKAAINRRHLQK